MSFRFKTLQQCPWRTQSKCLSIRTQTLPSACDRSLSASEKTGKGIGRPLCQVSKCAYGHSWCRYLNKNWGGGGGALFSYAGNLDHLTQVRHSSMQYFCVSNNGGTFNVHTDVNVCNCTLGLSGKSVLTVVFCDKCIVCLQTRVTKTVMLCVPACDCHVVCSSLWLSCCAFQLATVMLCVPACDCHVVCSSLWLSCCVFQLVAVMLCVQLATVMLCVPACDCHVVCSSLWLSCCVFQLVTVMLCVPACDCHVVCSSPG